MNILHLITSIDQGGAENHLASLSRGQSKNNKVTVAYIKGNSFWKNYYRKLGIKTFNLKKNQNKFVNYIKVIFFLKKLYKKYDIEVVHAHLPHMEFLGWLSVFFSSSKVKFIISKHVDNDFFGGSNYKNNSLLASLISKIISLKTKNIIAISHSVKNYFSNGIFKISKKKIKVIYYGIDNFYIQYLISKKNKAMISKKNIIFGYVGRLVKQKNIDFILKSYKLFCDKNPNIDALFIICGNGPERSYLKLFVKNLGLRKNVIWLGHTKYVGNVMKKIDVLCMNSNFEGLGLVMLEAMAFNKPIIAPKISAFPEVVINRFNGLLVKKNDIKGYSIAMSKMINNKFRNRLSKNSNKLLFEKFNFHKMINKTNYIYKN